MRNLFQLWNNQSICHWKINI